MEANSINAAGLGLLAILLAVAAWRDIASRRIPNAVVFPGIAIAFGISFFGGIAFTDCVGGLAIGLGAMLPFYFLRAAGAGDVKLMAMTGAFLGPVDALGAVLFTWLAGVPLGLAFLLARRGLVPATQKGPDISHAPRNGARGLPYGVAIALGTVVWVLIRGLA
jgi:prepilin peptidase CpaA